MKNITLFLIIALFILILYVSIVVYFAYLNGYFEPPKTICSNTYLNFSNLTINP